MCVCVGYHPWRLKRDGLFFSFFFLAAVSYHYHRFMFLLLPHIGWFLYVEWLDWLMTAMIDSVGDARRPNERSENPVD